MNSFRVFAFLTLGFICLTAKANSTFTVLVEDAYPLQYIENDQYQGPIAERVKTLLSTSGIDDYEVVLLPWARALQTAKQKSNHMIAGLVRTPEREHDYLWIGVVEQLDYYFYAKKSFLKSHSITQENLKQFRIGTIINSATDQFLRAKGFTEISSTSNAAHNYEKLINNRIDLIPASRTIFDVSCRKERKDCDQFVPVMPINMPSKALWLAVSKLTPAETVNTLRQQFTQID